jgi:hypothetical protein
MRKQLGHSMSTRDFRRLLGYCEHYARHSLCGGRGGDDLHLGVCKRQAKALDEVLQLVEHDGLRGQAYWRGVKGMGVGDGRVWLQCRHRCSASG